MRKHCWHHGNVVRLTLPEQKQVFCCWCGKEGWEHARIVRPPGHGAFSPVVYEWSVDADDETECLGQEEANA